MVERCCEIETTSAPVCFATRSAVRCLVPVSFDGIVGSGISWTLAYAIFVSGELTMIAPSIFASSYRNCGVNGCSSRMPPENRNESSLGSPTTMSAPPRERITSSIAWRRSVPGAMRCSASSSCGSRRGSSSDGVRVKPRAVCASCMWPECAMSARELRLRRGNPPPAQRRGDEAHEDAGRAAELQQGRRLVQDQRSEEHRADRLQGEQDRCHDCGQTRQRGRDEEPAQHLRGQREQHEPSRRRPGRGEVEIADDGTDRRATKRRGECRGEERTGGPAQVAAPLAECEQ